MQSHVNSRKRCARIYDDRLVQSSFIEVCDRVQQFAMSVEQILLRVLPRFLARIVDGPPVFFVTESRGFSLKRATKLIANAIHFGNGSLFLRYHRFISSGNADSTISFDCVIGYVATVQISTVRNDNTQTTTLKQVSIFCDGSSLGNGKQGSRAAAVALLGYKGYWRAVGEYLGTATNQQAEIVAAAVGLESLTQPG